jgi:hypothetical protein
MLAEVLILWRTPQPLNREFPKLFALRAVMIYLNYSNLSCSTSREDVESSSAESQSRTVAGLDLCQVLTREHRAKLGSL